MTRTDPTAPKGNPSEMQDALSKLRPYFVKSAWFTIIASS